MRICSSCAKEFDDSVAFCPVDGTSLAPPSSASSAEVDNLIGRVLDGKYRIEKKIGQGGMGAVFRARHVHMDTLVAVKMLHKESVANQSTVERFRREALSAARIRHPNAVIVTDFGVSDVGAYLVMEYLEGNDLRRKLRKHKTLSPDDTVSIIAQTCAAIERAHRIGLIHRDIKPDNIWLVTDEETGLEVVKVLDFGIAKLRSKSGMLAALTEQGTMIGTPSYMSPEQCLGQELDPRSDVYSIGCVLYEMLTGEVPFAGDNPVAIGMKHNAEAPRGLRQINPSVPEPIERVVLKALSKKPADRQPSARELSNELIEALKDSGSTAALSPSSYAAVTAADFSEASVETVAARTAMYTGGGPGPDSGGVEATVTDGAVTRHMASDSGPRPATVVGSAPLKSSRRPLLIGIAVLAVAVIAGVIAVPFMWPSSKGTVAAPPVEEPAANPPPVEGMVFIPGGTYRIGSDSPDASEESKPSIEVPLRPFYIDTHEVTNAQYAIFVQERGVRAPPHWKDGRFPDGAANLPVTNVTWFDAKAYARWARKRLPTEEEWEAAARGLEGRRFPWGDEWSPEFANSELDRSSSPSAVGSYPLGASHRGVFDLASNVAEWVDDEFEPYPGSNAKRAPGNCIFRGGTYRSPQRDHLSWERFFAKPESRFDVLGFRCAKDAE